MVRGCTRRDSICPNACKSYVWSSGMANQSTSVLTFSAVGRLIFRPTARSFETLPPPIGSTEIALRAPSSKYAISVTPAPTSTNCTPKSRSLGLSTSSPNASGFSTKEAVEYPARSTVRRKVDRAVRFPTTSEASSSSLIPTMREGSFSPP